MVVVAGVAAACVVGWLARPVVAMRRHGTLDERRLAAVRAEARDVAAAREEAATYAEVTELPLPRRSPEQGAPVTGPRSGSHTTIA